MEEKEIYRGSAVKQKTPRQTAVALLLVVFIWGVIVTVAKHLPASWIFELGAIILSAVLINKILKQGTFTSTYVLYADRLEVITRYGLIEKVTAVYRLSEAEFTVTSVKSGGKAYPFYPDEELKKCLNLKITS